jgi:hypothetical protein
MNRPPEDGRDRLLADVLAEATPDGFRAALLGETLRRARRRRQFRRARLVGSLLVVLGVLAISFWKIAALRRPQLIEPAVASCDTIRTQPLPRDMIVSTQPLQTGLIVASTPGGVESIRTTSRSGAFHAINDDELLALVAPHPAVLVRVGPHAQELVFANPADQDGFPVSN